MEQWSIEEKGSIILEIMHGDETAASICTRHEVNTKQAYKWLARFLEGGRSALTDKRTCRGRDPLPDEGTGWATGIDHRIPKKVGRNPGEAMKQKLVKALMM